MSGLQLLSLFLLLLSPLSSHLPDPSILVTSTPLSFSVALAAPWTVVAHLYLHPYRFHRCTPVFLTSLIPHGTTWVSHKYLSWASSKTSLALLLLFSRQVMSDSASPWTVACQASLSFTISQCLPRFMSIESVMPSNQSHPVTPFSFCLQSFAKIKLGIISPKPSLPGFQLHHHSPITPINNFVLVDF